MRVPGDADIVATFSGSLSKSFSSSAGSDRDAIGQEPRSSQSATGCEVSEKR